IEIYSILILEGINKLDHSAVNTGLHGYGITVLLWGKNKITGIQQLSGFIFKAKTICLVILIKQKKVFIVCIGFLVIRLVFIQFNSRNLASQRGDHQPKLFVLKLYLADGS